MDTSVYTNVSMTTTAEP